MDLRHLVTLRTVVDKGSFSQAAEELEISQPAVSFQIRALEERLGQRLLDRSGRRVTVTEAGEVAYRYAKRMIGLEAELEREMGEIGTRVSGRLVLGSSTGPGELLLPRLLGAFHAAFPDVRVSLMVSDTQTVRYGSGEEHLRSMCRAISSWWQATPGSSAAAARPTRTPSPSSTCTVCG